MEHRQSGSIEVAASARDAWRVCTSYGEFPEFIPGIASCRRDEDGTWHWTGRAFGITREWRSWEGERVEGESLAWTTDDPMVPDGRVVVEPLGAERSRVSIEMAYEARSLRDRMLVNPALARVRLALDLRHFRRRVERVRDQAAPG
jgi:uncharacterized membrane protein